MWRATHPWVLAVNGHHAVKRPVTLGLRGNGSVEILQGVAAGDRLVDNAAGVAPGDRVRIGDAAGADAR